MPQGSVLGPYLFLLYINDIVDKFKCNIRLFADDTSLFTVIENADSIKLIDDDLYNIAKWADDWCIILGYIHDCRNTSDTKRLFSRQPFPMSKSLYTRVPCIKYKSVINTAAVYHTKRFIYTAAVHKI